VAHDISIAERLTAADRSNTEWQHDLLVSYERLGDVLVAQGKLYEALQAYRDSRAIAERLAASNRSNTEWQRDLSVSYTKLGDVLVLQGMFDEALQACRDSLAIAERFVKADPGNADWQKLLSASYNTVGDVLVAQGKLDDALKAYRDGSNWAGRFAASDDWDHDQVYPDLRIIPPSLSIRPSRIRPLMSDRAVSSKGDPVSRKGPQADGETRSVVTASSIRRRSAAWTILRDLTFRSRRQAFALWTTHARSFEKCEK
jgi:tetratricopeptide (TPR) repeat protein